MDKITEEALWEEHLIKVQKPIWDLIDRLNQPSADLKWLMSPEVTETQQDTFVVQRETPIPRSPEERAAIANWMLSNRPQWIPESIILEKKQK